LFKGFFYLIALQILNLSIDTDYVAFIGGYTSDMTNVDDIDSYTELIIEKLKGDDNYTTETDDDSGNPQQKGVEKFLVKYISFDQITKQLKLHLEKDAKSNWTSVLDLDQKVCRGFLNVLSPPPKG
jgi:hypothetical protein